MISYLDVMLVSSMSAVVGGGGVVMLQKFNMVYLSLMHVGFVFGLFIASAAFYTPLGKVFRLTQLYLSMVISV